MVDIKDINKRAKLRRALSDDLKKLYEKIEHLNIKKEEMQSHCSHELILLIGKTEYYSNNVGYAICLGCLEEFYLNKEDKNIFASKNIIDLYELVSKGIINEKNIYGFAPCKIDNKFILRAQNKLYNLSLQYKKMEIEKVKELILKDLILFNEELEEKRNERKYKLIRKHRASKNKEIKN